ncbi:MAG: hypothetical protein ACNA7W_10480 [Pseudomonadales bacterium]
MAAAVLTLVIAFFCGGTLWLTLGARLALSQQTEQNDVLNLVAYTGAALPVAFALVFFLLGNL